MHSRCQVELSLLTVSITMVIKSTLKFILGLVLVGDIIIVIKYPDLESLLSINMMQVMASWFESWSIFLFLFFVGAITIDLSVITTVVSG